MNERTVPFGGGVQTYRNISLPVCRIKKVRAYVTTYSLKRGMRRFMLHVDATFQGDTSHFSVFFFPLSLWEALWRRSYPDFLNLTRIQNMVSFGIWERVENGVNLKNKNKKIK